MSFIEDLYKEIAAVPRPLSSSNIEAWSNRCRRHNISVYVVERLIKLVEIEKNPRFIDSQQPINKEPKATETQLSLPKVLLKYLSDKFL